MVAPMAKYEHGGDVYTETGTRSGFVDFSANLNPLGMPDEVVRALREVADSFDIYPDLQCRELRRALAGKIGASADHIVCTAGATDLIWRVCRAIRPQTALLVAPGFSGYEQALEQIGAHIVWHALREQEGFRVTERILEEAPLVAGAGPVGERTIVFLCSPNNPTGITIERGLVVRVLEAAQRVGATVVLDECFLAFTREASAVELCERFPNLVVMRAFTKTYAMAGLRLGYGVCSGVQLVQELEDAGQPWAVSAPAQVAGIAALGAEGWVERTRVYVDTERAKLANGLHELGMHVIPGEANYLLFRSPVPLYGPLLERGFLIRRCGNFEGLDDSWYRVAVRTGEQNAALFGALRDVVAEGANTVPK